MIDHAITFLHGELDRFLRRRFAENNVEMVQLSRLVDDQGALAFGARVGMALVKVDEERMFADRRPARSRGDEVVFLAEPEQVLQLHLVFVARERGNQGGGNPYVEALRSLAGVAAFFQSRRSFNPVAHPEMADHGLLKLNVELETIDYEVQNHVWGSLGGKLLPSLLYLVRLVAIDESRVAGVADPIHDVDVRGGAA